MVIRFAQTSNSPDGSDVLIENNLIADAQGNCDGRAPEDGTERPDIQPLRLRTGNNTIYDCGLNCGAADGVRCREIAPPRRERGIRQYF